MRRHGITGVGVRVLEVHETRESLPAAEIRLIDELGTHVSRGGVNHSTGGDEGPIGFRHSEASRAKMSDSQRKKPPMSEEHRRNLLASARQGEDHNQAVLDNEAVLAIKSRLWDGDSMADIAREYGVSHAAISKIKSDKNWKSIPWPTDRPRVEVPLSVRHAKLPDDTVRDIRRLHDEGVPLKLLAKRVGVSPTTAYKVFAGETYTHVC